jgi:hypothetical protein
MSTTSTVGLLLLLLAPISTAHAYVTTVYVVNSRGAVDDEKAIRDGMNDAVQAWSILCEDPGLGRKCAPEFGYDVIVTLSRDGCTVRIDDLKFQTKPTDSPKAEFIQRAFLTCQPSGTLHLDAYW